MKVFLLICFNQVSFISSTLHRAFSHLSDERLWIGLSDQNTEGFGIWVNDEYERVDGQDNIDLTFWLPTHVTRNPQIALEQDCFYIDFRPDALKFSDSVCANQNRGLCEKII